MAYRKFGPILKKKKFGWVHHLKDAPCAHGTSVFAMKFRESLWKLLYKQEMKMSKETLKESVKKK